ncbi:hypothetical protein [Flavobacterium psychrotrophum]|uniref:hypothetical protein n=1 Tax=Flavobacterium psychrotrophum TaxID=2294119 RepID=UPI000E313FC3|nr:hypothetical protein [Flavobacterium psychrotrophum]
MKARHIITLIIAVIVFFGFLKMRENFGKYKKDKGQQEIDAFYSKLHSEHTINYFEVQGEIFEIMSRNELNDAQKQRLLTTKDSLRKEFGSR